jgi:hypothetical protein
MLAGPKDHPVDRVFVQLRQACGGSHANSLGHVVDDLSDRLGRQMQAKQCAIMGRGKPFAASATVKQIAAFVLAILTAKSNDTLTVHAVVLALFISLRS